MGIIDRLVRLAGAIAIIILYAGGQLTGTAAIVLGAIALLLIGTSIAGICPAYPLLKISTLKKGPDTQQA